MRAWTERGDDAGIGPVAQSTAGDSKRILAGIPGLRVRTWLTPSLMGLIVMMATSRSVFGGVWGISCCITTEELQKIGLCVSGPMDVDRPNPCGETARCFTFHQSNAAEAFPDESLNELVEEAGDQATAGFLDSGAYCTSDFSFENVQGITQFGTKIDLFSVFDADQDGDLDLRDVAVFLETYDPTPVPLD